MRPNSRCSASLRSPRSARSFSYRSWSCRSRASSGSPRPPRRRVRAARPRRAPPWAARRRRDVERRRGRSRMTASLRLLVLTRRARALVADRRGDVCRSACSLARVAGELELEPRHHARASAPLTPTWLPARERARGPAFSCRIAPYVWYSLSFRAAAASARRASLTRLPRLRERARARVAARKRALGHATVLATYGSARIPTARGALGARASRARARRARAGARCAARARACAVAVRAQRARRALAAMSPMLLRAISTRRNLAKPSSLRLRSDVASASPLASLSPFASRLRARRRRPAGAARYIPRAPRPPLVPPHQTPRPTPS